ncbi:hypothetical protein KM043_018168 [Ampulex compressa]|nr:hypothetical protein KM043_018168 [Ampulex compressa]
MENVQVKNEEKNRCSSCRTEVRNDIHVKNQEGDRGSCCDARVENRSSSRIMKDDDEEREKEDRRILKNHWCCECLCEDMKTMEISGEQRAKSRTGRKVRKEEDPRLIKSAVGIALGLQKSGNNDRRNGLPTKKIVPRPRTPFARRSFCIDTLAPPFSIVNGCRDADYPEHWRLMSIYQQSYKNPQKRKGTNH